jgi:hypothetical protein
VPNADTALVTEVRLFFFLSRFCVFLNFFIIAAAILNVDTS